MKALAALMVLAMSWVGGLFAFADRVQRLTPAPSPASADGIVALTGGSDVRLKAATDLLEADKGARLLVSGVNPMVTRQDLWTLTGAPKPLFDCCVDLGFTAADTVGNARESAEWARAMRYHSLILVTADYHIPRAVVELEAAAPGLRITPYPVATSDLDARRWLDDSRSAQLMTKEYCKYLVSLARANLPGARSRGEGRA